VTTLLTLGRREDLGRIVLQDGAVLDGPYQDLINDYSPRSLWQFGLAAHGGSPALWQDTAGTAPVTADGQGVARVRDLAGYRDLLQSGIRAVPWEESARQIRFEPGTGTQTLTAGVEADWAFFSDADPEWTVVCRIQRDTGGNRQIWGTRQFTSATAVGANGITNSAGTALGLRWVGTSAGPQTNFQAVVDFTATRVTAGYRQRNDGANYRQDVFFQGSTSANLTHTQASGDAVQTAFNLGAQTPDGSGNPWEGWMSAVIVFDRPLSDTEMADIHTDLLAIEASL
jgi:hypothetical protein